MEGEDWIICYSLEDRPQNFEATKENKFVLITWKKR